jgi:hypothetical protein
VDRSSSGGKHSTRTLDGMEEVPSTKVPIDEQSAGERSMNEVPAGWGEMRGKFREREAWPLPPGQKFVHVDHDTEHGVRIEFVADEESSGSSDPDINKAQLPAGWKGVEPDAEAAKADFHRQEVETWEKINARDRFPQHGYGMAHGKKWEGEDRGATGTNPSPMLSKPLPNPAALQPHMAGVRHWQAGDPRLAPGGLVYEAALEIEGGVPLQPRDPPVVYRFPHLARGTAFVLDPSGSGCLMPLPSDLEIAQRMAAAASATVRRPTNLTMSVIEGSGTGKWAVREGWAGPEWGLEGLGRAWKVRETLGGKYRSFHAPDESVFFDIGEARYYGNNLTRLQRMDYRFRRTTRLGGPDASFATVDMAAQRAVYSRPDSIYGDGHLQDPGWNQYLDEEPGECPPVELYPLPPGWGPNEDASSHLAKFVQQRVGALGVWKEMMIDGEDGVLGGIDANVTDADAMDGEGARRMLDALRDLEHVDSDQAVSGRGESERVARLSELVLNGSALSEMLGTVSRGRDLVLELARYGMPDLSGGQGREEKIDILTEGQEHSVQRVRRCRAALWRFLLAMPLATAVAPLDGSTPPGLSAQMSHKLREDASVLKPRDQGAGNATRLRKLKKKQARMRREAQARAWWRQSQSLSLLASPSEQMRVWQVTHERLVLALCYLVDHDPWQIFGTVPSAFRRLVSCCVSRSLRIFALL